MDTSNLIFFGLPLIGSLLFLGLNIYYHRQRRKLHPGAELIPNQLLTTSPIWLMEGKQNIWYRGKYWNHLEEFLREHGHEAYSSRIFQDNRWGKSHIFFTESEIKSASEFSINHPENVASLNFVYTDENQRNLLENSSFKHYVKLIPLNEINTSSILQTTYDLLGKGCFALNKDIKALGSFHTRDYYELILKHSTELALEDLRD